MISCTRRCIPSSTHTSRHSPSPKALLARGAAAASPDHPQRERRKIKTDLSSRPPPPPRARSTVEHSCDGEGGGNEYLTRFVQKYKTITSYSHRVPPESQLCTPRTTEQRHTLEFPFVACQMEAYLCMLVHSHTKKA